MMLDLDYLFVYGTLLPEFKNEMSAFLKDHSRLVGDGSFQGCLYEIEGYPGAISSDDENDRVYGCLFEISDIQNLFKVLDAYEQCRECDLRPHLYRREKVLIDCTGGQDVLAWTYIYNLGVENLLLISSGDYLLFRGLKK
jgi:gamma-glutamylcyclotransferase (GGCT)/AIG2-like uncharacterized protein YtfP